MLSLRALSRKLSSAAPVRTKIRAAVATGPKLPFVLEDLFLDEPQAGEVLLKVVACGICHTDLVRGFSGKCLHFSQYPSLNHSIFTIRRCEISIFPRLLPSCLGMKVQRSAVPTCELC